MGDYMNPKTIKSQRWQIVNVDFVGNSSTLVYPSLLTSYAIRSKFPGRFDPEVHRSIYPPFCL